jgi:hypothetical protein
VPSGADGDPLPDGPGDGDPLPDGPGGVGVGDGAGVPTTGVGARPGYAGGGTDRTVERAGGSGEGRGAVAGSLPAGNAPAVGAYGKTPPGVLEAGSVPAAGSPAAGGAAGLCERAALISCAWPCPAGRSAPRSPITPPATPAVTRTPAQALNRQTARRRGVLQRPPLAGPAGAGRSSRRSAAGGR